MSLTAPEALAARRTFTADDIFFSATDPKGVITHANETFLRLAALEASDAVGQPHNLIRHPQMPGGIYRILWDELEAGRPVVAYMANEARDGVRYDVLATITPIDGGYLSIRLRPGVVELEQSVLAAYQRVAESEAALREAGGSRREVAQQGAALLLAELDELGFSSAAQFTRYVLPREIEELLPALSSSASQPAGGGRLASVLMSARAVATNADAFADLLSGYENLAVRVLAERESIAPKVGLLIEIGTELSRLADILSTGTGTGTGTATATGTGESEELAQVRELTEKMVGWNSDALHGLNSLPDELGALQTSLRVLALRISMFVLLSHTVVQFTSEVMASGQDRATELRLLHRALEQSLARVEAETGSLKETLSAIPGGVEEAVRSSDKVQLRADSWHKRLLAVLAESEFDDVRTEATNLANLAKGQLASLFALGEIVGLTTRMRQTPVRFDTAELRERLQHIAAGLSDLS